MTNKTHIAQLFKEHYRQLHRLARILLHDDDLARDIVHDVFASLLYEGKGDKITFGYLMKAVRNRCINYIRDISVNQRLANLYYMNTEEYEIEDWPDEVMISEIHSLIKSELSPRSRQAM